MSLERRLGFLAAAAALAIYASGLLSELPDLKVVIGDVAKALGSWTYALVGVMAFLETGAFVGLVAPGETVVIAGDESAGDHHRLPGATSPTNAPVSRNAITPTRA